MSNHSGQTFLREGTLPLGHVDSDGTGNNGEDHHGRRSCRQCHRHVHAWLAAAEEPRGRGFPDSGRSDRRYGEFEPDQSSEQMFELARLDALADKARKVAATRPR